MILMVLNNCRNSFISSKRRASELYHQSQHHSRNDMMMLMAKGSNSSDPNEFSMIDSGSAGDYMNDQSLYKSVHLDQLESSSREHDRIVEEYEKKVP